MAEKQMSSSFLDKITIANKIPALSKSLSNNDIPVPGYVYEEATRFSFLCSDESIDRFLSYLLEKVEFNEQPKTKLKVFKLLKFVVMNGDERFRQKLQKKDRLVKEGIGCIGAPDPLHGNSIYIAIRNEAKELLQVLFDETNRKETPNSVRERLGGMGSDSKTGRFEGFGSANVVANKTAVTKMVDGLSEVMDKILNAPYAQAEAVRSALEVDVGGYEAVSVPLIEPPNTSSDMTVAVGRGASTKHTHQVGRAGGGWEDDGDEQSDKEIRRHRRSCGLMSVDSLEGETCAEMDANVEYFHAEKQLVDEIVNNHNSFRSWIELDNLCQRCNCLNCDKLIELLQGRLIALQEDNVKMAILMTIEAFIVRDVVHFDQLFSTLESTLQQLQNTDSKDLNLKSTKILLVLEKLRLSNGDKDVNAAKLTPIV